MKRPFRLTFLLAFVGILLSACSLPVTQIPSDASPPTDPPANRYSGSTDGALNATIGIAVDGSGNHYVADTATDRIQQFNTVGAYITKWGSQGRGDWQFGSPFGVAVEGSDYFYVTDTFNHRIQKLNSTGAFLAKWGSRGRVNGQFSEPSGVAVDGSGHVYVADTNNYRIQVFAAQ